MKNSILVFLFFVTNILYGQGPNIEWQKSYGGSGVDIAFSAQETIDGGYIAAGSSKSINGDVQGNHGESDGWIIKVDNTGNMEWQKSLGGSGRDRARSIKQTIDGGYIVAGYSGANDGDVSVNNGLSDCWVVKLNNTGDITWEKSLGGSGIDEIKSIEQTTDGGYIIAGTTDSNDGDVLVNYGSFDCWVVKLNDLGSIIWQVSLGGSSQDYASSIKETTDGGYIVSASSSSNDGVVNGNHGGSDCWIIKLDSLGQIIWQKSFGGSGADYASSIHQTIDSGFILLGYSNSTDGDVIGNVGDLDYWIVKIDSIGNIVWQKSLGGSDSDYGWSIQQAIDGGFIIGGDTYSNDGDIVNNNGGFDWWIVKLDASGNYIWQKSLGGSGGERLQSIIQTSDEGIIAAGLSTSDDGDVTENNGEDDYWIVKLGAESTSLSENKILSSNLYPNPASNSLQISYDNIINSSYKIINSQGEKLIYGVMRSKEIEIDISELPNGHYSIVFYKSNLPILSFVKQ